jgi:peptidyl-prolyl cis-trans isomerase C
MIRRLRYGFLLCTLACGSEPEVTPAEMGDFSTLNEEVAGDVVASVNGQNIDSVSFQSQARRVRAADPAGLSMEEKQEVLDTMVEDALLYQEAVNQSLETRDEVRNKMIQILLREEVGTKISTADITDEEGQAYFEANKERFSTPAKINLQLITIRVRNDDETSAKASIDELHDQLRVAKAAEALAKQARQEGQDVEIVAFGKVFRDMALEWSQDTYRSRGGAVGWISATGAPAVPDEVKEVAFQLPVEALSAPIRDDLGWHIAWVKQKKEALDLTYQQHRNAVMRELKEQKQQARYDEFIAELKGRSSVSIDLDVLAAQEVRGQSSGRPSKTEQP